jgi:hypothetical protein
VQLTAQVAATLRINRTETRTHAVVMPLVQLTAHHDRRWCFSLKRDLLCQLLGVDY